MTSALYIDRTNYHYMWQFIYIYVVLVQFCILQVSRCIKVSFSVRSATPLGYHGVSAILQSTPKNNLDTLWILARILVSGFPFLSSRSWTWRNVSPIEATLLYDAFIDYPERCDKLLHLSCVISEPSLYDKIQVCPERFKPTIYRRGIKVELDTANELPLIKQYFPEAYTIQLRSRKPCYSELFLENIWNYYLFKTTKENLLGHHEGILRIIEIYQMKSWGYKIFRINVVKDPTAVVDSLIYIWRTIERGWLGLNRWLSEYENVITYLRKNCLETSSYWIARLLTVTFTRSRVFAVHGRKLGIRLLENFFDTCDHMNVQLSIIHELLLHAANGKIFLSKEKALQHDQIFQKLASRFQDDPYYGADDELALRAWRNRLLFFSLHDDLSIGGGIRDNFDFVAFYWKPLREVKRCIQIRGNLPTPVMVGGLECHTMGDVLQSSFKFCAHLLGSILHTRAGLDHLTKQAPHFQGAIIIFLLTWIANAQYKHDSIAMIVIQEILAFKGDNRAIKAMRTLIKRSEIVKYLRERVRKASPPDGSDIVLSIISVVSMIFTKSGH